MSLPKTGDPDPDPYGSKKQTQATVSRLTSAFTQ